MEEERRGGHTYRDHVAKSESYLFNRLNTETYNVGPVEVGLLRAGSFTSLEAATKLVNSTISQNKALVDQVASGEVGGARLFGEFDESTGYEAYKSTTRAKAYIRDTSSVEMYVRQDRNSANGFTVVTAFPIDEIIGSATRSLTVKQRAVVRDFLDEATSGRHSDAELQAMWCKTRAQIYVKKDDQVIEFLRMIRSHIA